MKVEPLRVGSVIYQEETWELACSALHHVKIQEDSLLQARKRPFPRQWIYWDI